MAEKQAACLNCRRCKTKCLPSMAGDIPDCAGCVQRGVRCVRPAYHVGRNPGSRNKLSGLQKAIYQIESALHNEGSSSRQDRELLNQFLDKIGSEIPTPVVAKSPVEAQTHVQWDAIQPVRPIQPEQPTRQVQWPSISTKTGPREAINGAESPLLLIAQAPKELSVETRPAALGHRLNARPRASSSEYEAFFGPFQPMLDTQPDLDPIELGLVDMDQAEQLFSYFYQNLSEMRWGLDPAIHSATFVHKRSLFLFTSILAVSTLFLPSAGASSKRLRLHCRKMADVVISKRLRSVEIILAFMVNVPWLTPGTHWADDETWMYLTAASTIALDLSLDKIILHPGTNKAVLEWSQTHQAECIDVQKVMDMDGFSNVDVTSEWGCRLIRRRERAWLTLWGLERGVCLARGRRWSVPVTPLIDFCDSWYVSDIAAPWDDLIAPAMVLRRDLLPSIEKLKANVLGTVAEEPLHDSTLKLHQEIEIFFQNWIKTCPCTIRNGERILGPYIDILSSHTRLSAYAHLINLPTTNAALRKQFRAAAFSAALCVLRTAVQREAELTAIPNNSVIMIAFSAIFTIQITSFSEKGTSSLTSTVMTLINEVANVLERIGNVTPHRNGISALFSVHIRHIVKLASPFLMSKGYDVAAEVPSTDSVVSAEATQRRNDLDDGARQDLSTTVGVMGVTDQTDQPVDFSNISMDQIANMIDAMGDELSGYSWGFDMDNFPDLNLLDWDQFN